MTFPTHLLYVTTVAKNENSFLAPLPPSTADTEESGGLNSNPHAPLISRVTRDGVSAPSSHVG